MIDLTEDVIKENLPAIVDNKKRKPNLERLASREDIFQHSMFEYYFKVYSENPGMKGHHYYKMVSDHFNKDIVYIVEIAKKFSWLARARKASITMRMSQKDPSGLAMEATDMIKDMVANAHLIAKLGTDLISRYLINVNPKVLHPRDIFKLGMLVVECVRVTNEVTGGSTTGQSQGQTIQLVINE